MNVDAILHFIWYFESKYFVTDNFIYINFQMKVIHKMPTVATLCITGKLYCVCQ